MSPLSFTHAGRDWQLTKHPRVLAQLKAGQITLEQAQAALWYFRLDRVARSLETANDAEAIRRAKERLRLRDKEPDSLTEFLDAKKAAAGVTCGTLATEWRQLRCPLDNGLTRSQEQIDRLDPHLVSALRFWKDKAVAAIKPSHLTEFAGWRRAKTKKGFTGNRSVDLDLNAMSVMCDWAKAAGRTEANPFSERPTFRPAKSVEHCHTYAPESDEELHRIIGWMLSSQDERRVVSGAHLMLSALTGLRPGEPGALLANPKQGQLGEVWTRTQDEQKTTWLRVRRTKAGHNPGVRVHSALADFLDCWRQWLAVHIPAAVPLFPNPDVPSVPLVPVGESKDSRLRIDLRGACTALSLPERHAHAMRAFYVRVRRAQGENDSQIGSELGHSGGSRLVTQTYGDPADVLGDGRFDWLPETGIPCWHSLRDATANVIPLHARRF